MLPFDDDGLHLHAVSKPFSPYADRAGAEGPFFRGDDADQVTQHLLRSRTWMLDKLADYRVRHPDRSVQIITPPTIPTLRMTRRLVGAVSLGERHDHHRFDDTVGLTGDWRKRGPVYAFPLRSLAGVRNDNLLAAGRCMSADTTAWDVTRALPGSRSPARPRARPRPCWPGSRRAWPRYPCRTCRLNYLSRGSLLNIDSCRPPSILR